jgi:hypothetical protein
MEFVLFTVFFSFYVHWWRDKWVEGFGNNTPALTALELAAVSPLFQLILKQQKDANTSTY